jgi:hypothetical protein
VGRLETGIARQGQDLSVIKDGQRMIKDAVDKQTTFQTYLKDLLSGILRDAPCMSFGLLIVKMGSPLTGV